MDKQQLIRELQNGDDQQRRAASYKLGKSKDPSVVPALINAYYDPDAGVRQNVIRGLHNIGSKEAIEFLNSSQSSTEERRWRFITEESQRWRSIVESRLLPAEQLIDVVGDLSFSLYFVPHVGPGNYQTSLAGTLALTIHRLIAIWSLAEAQSWQWFHIPAINSLFERPLHPDKRSWPYQAILMIPGGMGLVVQTQTPHAEHGKRLSSLLTEGFMRFGVRRDDDSALAAIITHEEEEEERRRRVQDY